MRQRSGQLLGPGGRAALASLALLCPPAPGQAGDPTRAERQAILDAIRPLASAQARQPVRIVVQRLNRADGWAVLEGGLAGPGGKTVDWSRARDCEPELDKLLWAVLRREGAAWRVLRLDICAPEPPYWQPETLRPLNLPCGVLAGLQSAEGADLAAQCRRERGPRPNPSVPR